VQGGGGVPLGTLTGGPSGRGPRDLAFKQAYEIYHKCRSDSQKDPDSLNLLLQTKKELLASPRILAEPEFWSDASRAQGRRDAIKSTMNSKRVDYTMPKDHSINITPY
jgi:hypothetical protein